MRLPNAEDAIIPKEKICGYLLSSTHPLGRYKAVFFEKLGYHQANWKEFEKDLREQHLTESAEKVGMSPDGMKFRIAAPLIGPSGKRAKLVTIWIVESKMSRPRLVTAYPGGEP
ncbi:adhesin [Candidatus Acetothermia bacterium]|nr:adhesin [Candidatus Acetothermia bacterium]MBI3642706.1 adhesin [Candidatus Acetothermia bacterium]